MKLLILGDTQLDAAPAYDRRNPTTGRSVRFDENVATIQAAIRCGLNLGATGLLHLGDLTENKDPTSLELEAAAEIFRVALDGGARVWAIAGNHDGALFDVSSSSLASLARMAGERFKLFHHVAYDAELGMLAVPYVHRASPDVVGQLIDEVMESVTFELDQHVFAAVHYGLQGCAVGPRNLVLPGDYLGPEQFIACGAEGLDHVFAGHIHKAQQLPFGVAHGWHPGSPVICDMGERDDEKTVLLFDTVTRAVEVLPVPQPRAWVSLAWESYRSASPGGLPWFREETLVRITGTCARGEQPRAVLEDAFKSGMLARPFALEVEVKPERQERPQRSLNVSAGGGLKQAVQEYVRERFPRQSEVPGQVAPATALALDALREQGAVTLCTEVWPTCLRLENFLTFSALDYTFAEGAPTLVTGENGVGKTNLMEAVLFALTGKTSKGLELGAVVRQGTNLAEVQLDLTGTTADVQDQRFSITRTVKLSKAGKASQTMTLEAWNHVANEWGQELSDGGVAEVQARIEALVGGSFLTLRTTAFKFQQDPDTFLRCHPSQRKGIVGEITGLAPLARAFKVLEGRRLASGAALTAQQQALAGILTATEGDETRATATRADREKEATTVARTAADLPALRQAAETAAAYNAGAVAKVREKELQLAAVPETAAEVARLEEAIRANSQHQDERYTEGYRQLEELKKSVSEADAAWQKLEAPTAAQVASALAEEVAAGKLLQEAATDLQRLQRESDAAARSYEQEVSGGRQLGVTFLKARGELEQLGPAADVGAALALVEQGRVAEQELIEADQTVLANSVTARGIHDAAKRALHELEVEHNELGSSTHRCRKCGQPVTEEYLAAERARLTEQIVAQRTQVAETEALVGVAAQNYLHASQAKLKAQEVRRAAEQAYGVAQSRTVLRASLQRQVESFDLQLAANTSKGVELATAAHEMQKLFDTCVVFHRDAQAAAVTTRQTWQRLQSAEASAAALVHGLKINRERVTELEARLAKWQEQYVTRNQELAHAKGLAQHAHRAATELREQLTAHLVTARAVLEAATTQLTTAQAQATSLQEQANLARAKLGHLDVALAELEQRRHRTEQARFELAQLQERSQIDALSASLLDPREGLPVFLIDQSLPFLEERVNHYCAELGLDGLSVELTTLDGDKETLAVLVDNGHPGPKLDVAAYSGGQLDRIEYGLKCALADLCRQTRGVTLGLQCFDEPTGGLNAEGKERLIRLLYERANTYRVTLVTSHDADLRRAFDQRVHLVRGPADETVVEA